MRKLLLSLVVGMFTCIASGQTIETGKKIEYKLSGEDCHEGLFYLGKFNTGTYEISANVAGYDANNCGWKIVVGKNWGRAVSLNELFNTLNGSFYYLLEGTSVFHLWWKSEYKDIKKSWYPHIKVEYQVGKIDIDADEPTGFSNASKLTSIITQRSNTVQMSGLKVNGVIHADEIKVEDIAAANMNLSGDIAANNITVKANGNTADFVFEEDYDLKELSEVETFIKTNKHLPNIPSANEMEEQGVNLAEMNKLLLQKVEELTLYAISQEGKLDEKIERIAKLEEARIKEQAERRREKVEREKLESELNAQSKKLKKLDNIIKKIIINKNLEKL